MRGKERGFSQSGVGEGHLRLEVRMCNHSLLNEKFEPIIISSLIYRMTVFKYSH